MRGVHKLMYISASVLLYTRLLETCIDRRIIININIIIMKYPRIDRQFHDI